MPRRTSLVEGPPTSPRVAGKSDAPHRRQLAPGTLDRLPRARDRDLYDLRYVDQLSLAGIGGVLGISAAAVSKLLDGLAQRLKLLEERPSLRIAEIDQATTVEGLITFGFNAVEARFLWDAFWTSSPTVARLRSAMPRRRAYVALGRLMDLPVDPPARGRRARHALRLRDAMACIKDLGWGCLWGRQGRHAKPGDRGNRFDEAR